MMKIASQCQGSDFGIHYLHQLWQNSAEELAHKIIYQVIDSARHFTSYCIHFTWLQLFY